MSLPGGAFSDSHATVSLSIKCCHSTLHFYFVALIVTVMKCHLCICWVLRSTMAEIRSGSEENVQQMFAETNEWMNRRNALCKYMARKAVCLGERWWGNRDTRCHQSSPETARTLVIQPGESLKMFILEIKEDYAITMNITYLNPSFHKWTHLLQVSKEWKVEAVVNPGYQSHEMI